MRLPLWTSSCLPTIATHCCTPPRRLGALKTMSQPEGTSTRVAELQPDDRELWIERTRLHIDEGAFDAAAESAARIEALPGSPLLGRLLAAQAAAATEPLPVALDTLGTILEPEDFESDELLHIESTAGILTVSVRNFGPRYLPQGLAKIRDLLTNLPDEGVVSDILTDFLIENIDDGFVGSLADWERALESLVSSLADLPGLPHLHRDAPGGREIHQDGRREALVEPAARTTATAGGCPAASYWVSAPVEPDRFQPPANGTHRARTDVSCPAAIDVSGFQP